MPVPQGIQTTFVFSFSKNVFYPNQTFLRLDFSLYSIRGFDNVLKRAFLNFLFFSDHALLFITITLLISPIHVF